LSSPKYTSTIFLASATGVIPSSLARLSSLAYSPTFRLNLTCLYL